MVSRAERQVADIAELLVWHTLQRPPTLGAARLVCVDGPAGSGKTTLARAIVAEAAGHGTTRLVHMDDVYEGWSGLDAAVHRVADELVTPLARGDAGRYQRYDWETGSLAEWHTVEPVDLLVIEGVGSGAAAYDVLITTLVWVEAPAAVRLQRGLARDGEAMRAEWLAWMATEERLHAAERTRSRAHVVVDGTGERDTAVTFA